MIARWVAVGVGKHGAKGNRAHAILNGDTGVACGLIDDVIDAARGDGKKLKCGTCETVVARAEINAIAASKISRAVEDLVKLDPELTRRIAASAVAELNLADLLAETLEYEYVGGSIRQPRGYSGDAELIGDEIPAARWGTEEQARAAVALAAELWETEKAERPWLKREPILRLARRRKLARPEIIE